MVAAETPGPRARAASSLATVLVPTGASWRYLDTGVDLGTAWSATGFDDAAWAEGAAPLGYAETDLGTTVSYGPNANSKYITTYLRKRFTVEDAARVGALLVRLQRDDGAIVYLNGAEVFRSNLPAGTVGYRTLAPATVSLPAEETTWLEQSVSPAALVTGTNVLAVEVHQSAANTSDMRFDLELSATVAPDPNPMSACYPFDMPTPSVLRAARKKVFGFYYPIFPISIENKDPSVDFWSSWLDPTGRNSEYGAIGGLMRDRPLPRPPWSGNWRQRDFETEVRRAIAAGLDGFIYEHPYKVSSNEANNQLETMLAAALAVDPGFRIVLSPDFPYGEGAVPDQVATKIASVANHPSLYRHDGAIVLSSFGVQRNPIAYWSALQSRLSAMGIATTYWAFHNYASPTTSLYSEWNDLSVGYSTWGSRPASSGETMRLWSAEAHRRGRLWMSPVAFEDVRHKDTGDRNSSRVYWEAQNSLAFRTQFEKAIEGDADWVSLLTMTDYGESWMTASQERGYVIMDWIAYYTAWFKTGQRPTILRDTLYYTHRRHRTDAPFDATKQTAPQMVLKGGPSGWNQVELLAFLAAPGRLVITQGSDVRTLDVASAGVTPFSVPLVPGTTPVFELQRNGQTVQRLVSRTPIVARTVYQDMMYHAGGGRECARP
ncbi:hypothetical protein LY474_18205 [Myxococcus stipitatus]|uniref:endo-1,3-alpha-glucanase family glycosylhydrolase n=1 Tax=Myxococcus stipitatus TaxID=83455 RepID=UPI001F3168B3|nr:endo-1,3-alpha-glucanase family glycosylhydrolase [Myxococcus stipitatus]MCE9669733.1 hypothetical protein [Myxococcus stipitatus]